MRIGLPLPKKGNITLSIIREFITSIQAVYATGAATEHSYRAAIGALIDALGDDLQAINEPKRIKCGAPDFIINRDAVAIGHIEAKDIDIDLRSLKGPNLDQKKRYLNALPNLIYTNCLDWEFYRDGELVARVSVADLTLGIQPRPDHYATLENLLREFITQTPQTITHPVDLAERMAGKANLIKDVLAKILLDDSDMQTELAGQYQAFQENLIHDISPGDFADIYAETIAYGMFAARLHDTSLDSFTRQEALELLPKSNPFLRNLFSFIAGYDLDDRIAWVIDDLARVFLACDLEKLMQGFGRLTGRDDPFLHFYETFLAAYNPAKRKARGVWYTPEPVVDFIVRAVDDVLQTEFGLADGLADTSKVTVDWDTGQTHRGKAVTIRKDVHRVQILDPATGTGTFLAQVINLIAPRIQGVAPGMWSQYIENDLIPRLHGFELLMASYAMCHMKLDMVLKSHGYTPDRAPRLSVYLTNSLEEGEPTNQTLPFTKWLSDEAKGANTIKRDAPVMCVIGNPPYLGEGGKSIGWIGNLMEDYKKEPGGKAKLKERNPKWLNDLYVKFIRMSSHMIEKNGEGILGFITNHGYLDNPTFRGMRWHLLNTFDKIYVLDLHGNSKKKEVTPDGAPDKNVFDIMQGVAIIIAVRKKGKRKGLGQIMQGDLWGSRKDKNAALARMTLNDLTELHSPAPQHPFVRRDYAAQGAYEQGFAVNQFMPVNSVGIVTARDGLTIDDNRDTLWQRVRNFAGMDPEQAREKYKLGKDVQDWQVGWAQDDLNHDLDHAKLTPIAYRPFDTRWTYYTGKSRGFLCRPRNEMMRHMLAGGNLALAVSRQNKGVSGFGHVFCHTGIAESSVVSNKTSEISSSAPLYLYPTPEDLDQTRRVNFDAKLWKKLQKLARHPRHGTPDEVQTFDYIYGVLHCPAYRDTYAEFLKIDFPRIPWPANADEFWQISAAGRTLRQLHLMDPATIGDTPFAFMGDGDNMVDNPRFDDGKVWINETQYFNAALPNAWDFHIGGYQPAQKWLKDRKGRALSFDDVKHYQRILKILSETARVMAGITMAGLNVGD
jgi:hypothetical protein